VVRSGLMVVSQANTNSKAGCSWLAGFEKPPEQVCFAFIARWSEVSELRSSAH
jgi:hypothetical protein